ncbi:glutathione S-transferase family protein [Falsigemmobacter faecalis]|uniref:Glutathione S-transferase n=1 Tax=Falsigemmobacter faecalis TaxID=2488730 RepID=A0A3P3DSG9_9RHOB|nr:glutathione S-transferase [Falsigemmobacter faecalis]RRH76884.1 glutathione S-transferase [Falsigemmobacter faecalis]
MSAGIELWHVPQSRSLRVLWFLHEAGLPHRLHLMGFDGSSLRTREHLTRSPAGRVPAVEIDGEAMAESGAILDYLAETRAPALGRAPGHPERRAYLEGLHYGETIGQHLANLTQHHVILREPQMRSATVMRLEAARLAKTLTGALRRMEGRDWLLPSGFSAADIAVGYGVWQAKYFLTADEVPGLSDWQARIAARPGFQAALAADGPPLIYRADFYPRPEA